MTAKLPSSLMAQSSSSNPERLQDPEPLQDPERLQVRGLVLLSLLLALFAVLRALLSGSGHALFAPGWWRIL